MTLMTDARASHAWHLVRSRLILAAFVVAAPVIVTSVLIGFVRAFDRHDQETVVSTSGGEQPRWARDRKELFFEASDGKMMVTTVNTQGASFTSSPPRALFDVRLSSSENGAQFQYDVSTNGQSFFITTARRAFASAPPLTLVLNWQAGLPEAK